MPPAHDSSRASLDRRRLLRAAAGGMAVAALPGLAGIARALADGEQRPNIVWFRSEDNSASFIGAYGNELAVTPTIDRLAEEGVRYANFFTTSPVCAPTKLAILTGMYEAGLGPGHHMRAAAEQQPPTTQLPDGVLGFAAYLADVGYWCTESGNTDYNAQVERSGYHDSAGNWQDRPEGAPFFALLGNGNSHETNSFYPVAPFTDPADVELPAYHPDTPVMRRDRAHYMDMVTLMDDRFGALLQQLEDEGVAEDTIVVYSSDHGGVLARSKRFCYDSGLHAPLIIRFPERWQHLAPGPPGTVIDAPVSSIDMPPTLLQLAGVAVPDHMQGQAFLGQSATERAYAFSNRNRMDEAIDFVRTVRDPRYRYIRNYMPHLPWGQHVLFMWLQAGVRDWEQRWLLGQTDEVQSRFWEPKPAEELYDLQADPDEVVNLIDAPEHAERVEAMRAALDAYMLAINDNGFIPEASPAEGWAASREPGAFPIERVMDLAWQVIQRDPTHLPALLAALRHPNYIVRYWGALGCAMLGADADPGVAELSSAMAGDAEPWVQVQAADALVRIGHPDLAVPFLTEVAGDDTAAMPVRLAAVWALRYAGSEARSAVPTLTAVGADTTFDDYVGQTARYAVREITGTYVPAP